MKQIAALALVAVISMSQVACTKDQVTATLAGLVNAAAVYEDAANPQYKPIVDAVVLNCIDPSLEALQGTGTGAAKTIAILGFCTPAVASLSGNPQLADIALALNAFLDSVRTLTAEAQSTPSGALAFAGSTKAAKVDKAKLKQLRDQVDQLKAKIATHKK